MEWVRRIRRAEKAGRFINNDYHLSGSWKTCAVGERQAEAPDWGTELYGLGMRFSRAVVADDIPLARTTYEQIARLFGLMSLSRRRTGPEPLSNEIVSGIAV